MKKTTLLSFTAGLLVMGLLTAFTDRQPGEKYVLVHEASIAKTQPGPHHGGGTTIAYPFFENVLDLALSFRKRVLQPGAAIGYHLQEKDEIYYILEGSATMQMNGAEFPVTAGDAVLTRPGSRHGLKAGAVPVTVLITYPGH